MCESASTRRTNTATTRTAVFSTMYCGAWRRAEAPGRMWSLRQPQHIDLGPVFAGDEDPRRLRIVGNAVEVAGPPPRPHSLAQSPQVEPAVHLAAEGIDAGDPVAAEDIRPDFTLDHFQLVEPGDRPAAIGDGQSPMFREIVGIDKAQLGTAVTHDQPSAVVGQPPALPGVRHPRQRFEGLAIIDKGHPFPP